MAKQGQALICEVYLSARKLIALVLELGAVIWGGVDPLLRR
jgi:hypothetical protein